VAESFPAVVIHPIGGMPVGLVAGFHGRGGPARAGDRSRAFRMLRDDVDRLLDTTTSTAPGSSQSSSST
jgi:hypothetical protein